MINRFVSLIPGRLDEKCDLRWKYTRRYANLQNGSLFYNGYALNWTIYYCIKIKNKISYVLFFMNFVMFI